jgi:hypothetical protein
MRVLAGGNDNRVEFILVFKKFAEVSRFPGLGALTGSEVQIVLVDITQGNDILPANW